MSFLLAWPAAFSSFKRKSTMNKLFAVLSAALLSVAAAHATVKTEAGLTESKAGASETYRLQVPSEKAFATTEVRLVIPEGVSVSRFQTMPGFSRTVRKNDAGLVTEVVWRGKIASDEFARFFFQAKNPAQSADLAWKVYQTYADGSVVAWDDADKENHPASHTAVK